MIIAMCEELQLIYFTAKAAQIQVLQWCHSSCGTSELVRKVYPGELLPITVVAVGQENGVVPTVIRAFFTDTYKNTSLAQFQDTQDVKETCTVLYYKVHSSIINSNNTLVVHTDSPCSTAGNLSVLLHFLPCPFLQFW